MTYQFDDVEIDLARLEIRRGGQAVPVEPQVFDVLRYLVEHRDRVVPKDELLERVWNDRFVSESALTSRIKAARRAVGDDGQSQRTIRTAHGRGYRFVADVREADERATGAMSTTSAAAPAGQQIRFCRAADGTRLAYAAVGDGPPLVKAANWLSHLDYDWESPVWRHWWRGLADRFRLVRYDDRGCGLSDWVTSGLDLETWVSDLAAVVDAAGLDRFDLLGISRGGPVAIAYAARYPERVSHLVLYGAFLQGRLVRATTQDDTVEAQLQVQLARLGWGRDIPAFRQVFAAQFMPHGTRQLWEAFDELQRRTTSPGNAAAYLQASGSVDATAFAPQVQAPTLVLHGRGDRRVPLEQGRLIASLVPNSRLVTLDSENHILLEDEPAWPQFLEEMDRFLTPTRRAAPGASRTHPAATRRAALDP
jgi:pimeloyl-ACP methyl ester carboxylesterase/DNA-binding winged helix-turn-helix (wHTH) protein